VIVVLRASTWLCAVLFVYTWFAMASLRYQYTREMPQVAQKEVGRVCPVPVYYGKTVYVTKEEKENLSAHFYYILGSGVLAILAEFTRRVAVAAGVGERKKSAGSPHQGDPAEAGRDGQRKL
jgi:hypothetical protein